jgi:hypothetical protein
VRGFGEKGQVRVSTMGIGADHAASPAAPPSTPFLSSPELRVVAALLAGAAALLFAILLAVARWTDLMVLDLRGWQPAASVRGLEGAALRDYFDGIQTPGRRPFRLTLRLPVAAEAGDVLAAEAWIPRRDGRHCFFVIASPTTASAPETTAALATTGRVWVEGRLAAAFPVAPTEQARAIELRAVDLEGGARVRFEIVAEPATAGGAVTPGEVHFEMATLRRCDS